MWNNFFKAITIIGLILLVWLFIVAGLNYSKFCEGMKDRNWDLQQRLRRCEEINPFQSAVSEIGGRVYRKEYDCLAHAVDLYDELERKGIKSSILISEDREHAWLGVWIETTEGNFIDPDSDLKIIEIRNGNLMTVCSCK